MTANRTTGEPIASMSGWVRDVAVAVRSHTPSVLSGVLPVIIEVIDRESEQCMDEALSEADARTAHHADSYGIALPVGWVEQPLDPSAFERALSAQKAQLLKENVGRADIRRFELLQRQVHEQLVAEQVQYVATLASRGPGHQADEDDSILLAAAVITARTRRALGGPGPITTGLLLRSFGGSTTGEDGINIEEPSEIDLPVGKAFRLVRFHSQQVGSDSRSEKIEYYEHAYLIPHDEGERVAFLHMVTPTLAYTEPLGELFDALATTLRIFYPEDPTTFETSPADRRP